MSEATAQEPVPEPPLDVTAVMQLAVDRVTENTRTTEQVRQILARIEEILAGDADRAGLGGLVTALVIASHRQAEQGADLREIPGAIADATLFTAAGLTGPMAAVPDTVPEPRVARHRAPRQRTAAARSPHLRGLPAWVAGPAVAAWEVARHPAQHAVAASLMAGTAATLVVGGGAAVHAVTSPGAGSSPNPVASVVAATPLLPTSPSSPLSPSALLKPNPDAATSLPLGTLPPVSSPVQGPGDGQGAPAPDPSSQGLAPQVTLVVSHSLNLGLKASGTIRLAAFGGSADWSASASDGGMMLDQSSGTLNRGDSTTIRVSITADLQALTGPGSVTIDYGDGKSAVVQVSWTVIPPSVPDPVASVLPTDLPSALPSIGT